ncbi:23S rRNA pseudouridine(1911/1915/1917) synthase RluD [Reinekea marinisedimentorum]|uniref:Pseudouridine synthase n=1 Tax=Reinekea marinisedimentorum TaxID=230495 RepID=A0A4V2UIJ5_9GAMM|nr:23S rRNA pseudouridine(1911/1915/1917) synthase RluD [Reinekea marinisedimentorum]TCS36430.1 23S rRNA pseudouridine1911/1915/1917 synthase [Reinekea marinisedimentorum]
MTDASDSIKETQIVPFEMGNKRFDQVAAELFSDYSRSRIQGWIKDGSLTVNGQTKKTKDKLVGGETLLLDAVLQAEERWEAEPVELDVVYQDDDIIVINKPAGLVVHPGAGTPSGTVLNGLLYRFPELASVPRAGIVHRLDKDTTGLMVVARNLPAQTSLSAQLQDRSMGREYLAVCMGIMTGGGVVDAPIDRHPKHRTKMAVAPEGMGRDSVTHYRVEQRFRNHTLVRCKLETGRTHQIRVHLSHIGYPLVGDPLYAGRSRLPKGVSPEVMECLKGFRRQALHAGYLELIHPATQEMMDWEVDLPEDFQQLLEVMQDELELFGSGDDF